MSCPLDCCSELFAELKACFAELTEYLFPSKPKVRVSLMIDDDAVRTAEIEQPKLVYYRDLLDFLAVRFAIERDPTKRTVFVDQQLMRPEQLFDAPLSMVVTSPEQPARWFKFEYP